MVEEAMVTAFRSVRDDDVVSERKWVYIDGVYSCAVEKGIRGEKRFPFEREVLPLDDETEEVFVGE